MFKQMKSALFWYYLYKFRKRAIFIFFLLLVALFSGFIYGDVVEYLKLTQNIEYLKYVLALKWFIIIFNSLLSIYLILWLSIFFIFLLNIKLNKGHLVKIKNL